MPTKNASANRLIIISDLHLGGVEPYMMSQPKHLAEFIAQLPTLKASDEILELIIAGDFIDFLAIPEFKSWTPNPKEAQAKLKHTLQGPFAPVFSAIAEHIANGHRLTILIGNHDTELVLPSVQTTLLQALGADHHQILWIDDGSAYQVGGALIEHGNRYDGANINDWESLGKLRSTQSRGEKPPPDFEFRISAGSEIVENVVNPLKTHYPFIDLIQPQNALLALLLLAFEPELIWDWKKIAYVLEGRRRQGEKRTGTQPGQTYAVSASVPKTMAPALETELRAEFGKNYDTLMNPSSSEEVSVRNWARVFLDAREQSLAELIKQGKPIPVERLNQIRLAMHGLVNEKLFDFKNDADTYSEHAQQLRDNIGAEVVVMGHTHLARHYGPTDNANYINTGTWADLIKVPDKALIDSVQGLEKLETFLRGLIEDSIRWFRPTYADIRINAAGNVEYARLQEWKVKV